MSEEIKPCIYCGEDAHIVQVNLPMGAGLRYYLECWNPDCMAEGPVAIDKSGALEKWNDRSEVERLHERLKVLSDKYIRMKEIALQLFEAASSNLSQDYYLEIRKELFK